MKLYKFFSNLLYGLRSKYDDGFGEKLTVIKGHRLSVYAIKI